MNEQRSRGYDLEERTFEFAHGVKELVRYVPRTISNIEYCKQLVRSSGSVAANYLEANNALSSNDLCHRIKICRKEARESTLWLRLLDLENAQRDQRERLAKEAQELVLIFAAILRKKGAIA